MLRFIYIVACRFGLAMRVLIFGLSILIGSMSAALARSYPLEPAQPAIGAVQTYVTKENDTLLDVARDFDIGYTEIVIANPGVDPWVPRAGKEITIPAFFLLPNAERRGIVVNLVKQRLYYYPQDGRSVQTFPIGVGGEGRSTPLGVATIVRKKAGPSWYPPPSIRAEDPELPAVVPPGPDNPMGAHALYLSWPTYTIHGTNKPDGIGRNSSHGCLRMYPEDVAQLFGEAGIGTPVRVINEEAEWAWIDDELFLSVFPTKEQTEEINIGKGVQAEPPPDLAARIAKDAGERAGLIDWALVDQVARERSGLPIRVSEPSLAPMKWRR